MLKLFLSVILSISLITVGAHYVPEANFNTVRQATWIVDTGLGMCSGVLVAPKHLLTAAHCDGPELKVGSKPARKVFKDDKNDLMLLIVEVEGPTIPLANKRPAIDEKVIMVGYPLGMGQVATEGRVQKVVDESIGHMLLISAPGVFGNSGGPVVVRRGLHYEVVGIASALAITPVFGMIPNIVTHLVIVADVQTLPRI